MRIFALLLVLFLSACAQTQLMISDPGDAWQRKDDVGEFSAPDGTKIPPPLRFYAHRNRDAYIRFDVIDIEAVKKAHPEADAGLYSPARLAQHLADQAENGGMKTSNVDFSRDDRATFTHEGDSNGTKLHGKTAVLRDPAFPQYLVLVMSGWPASDDVEMTATFDRAIEHLCIKERLFGLF